MTVLAVRHTVSDFATWKTGFDNHSASRKEHGATHDQVLQSVEDPNNLLVLIDFESVADAQAFANDPALEEAMSKAGVIGAPDISIREATF